MAVGCEIDTGQLERNPVKAGGREITIGFGSHHIEALPYFKQEMARHKVIVLEEPPSPYFLEMLEGALSVDRYLLEVDSQFPQFDRRMCLLLRKMYRQDRRILQIEPYLEKLIRIHEFFAGGKTPQDIAQSPELGRVYRAERNATGALISYYQSSTGSDFEKTVQAVKRFARCDADRLKLRQHLRARAIAMLQEDRPIFVEAGYIHYPLFTMLKREVPASCRIRVVHLLQPIVKKIGGRRRNLGPGDLLTLHYLLHGNLKEGLANLLAARSLIYIKLIKTEELFPGRSPAPHAEDIAEVNALVDRLDFEKCREIFQGIRFTERSEAKRVVMDYLGRIKNDGRCSKFPGPNPRRRGGDR